MVRPYRFRLEEFLKLPLPGKGVELLEGEVYQMVPEVWVQDLLGGRLLRIPEGDHYRGLWVKPGEKVAPLAFPEASLEAPW